MSSFVNFYTFEQMENATIEAVSSEVTDYHAEHAIIPLEPNMSWKANEASAQHILTIDLEAPYECNCFFWLHHETDVPSPLDGLTIEIERSHDATNWADVITAGDDGATGTLLKVATFTTIKSRYWRITFLGTDSPNYYAPTNMRISVAWLGTSHALDVGPAFPMNEQEDFPSDSLNLSLGKTFTTGRNINNEIIFDRTWMLREDQLEWSTLLDVLKACNGTYRPFVYTQSGNGHMLCRFERDSFEVILIETNLFYVTLKMVASPIVQKDGYH